VLGTPTAQELDTHAISPAATVLLYTMCCAGRTGPSMAREEISRTLQMLNRVFSGYRGVR